MKAFKCDKCGAFYSEDVKIRLPEEIKPEPVTISIKFHRVMPSAFYGTAPDICLECIQECMVPEVTPTPERD